MKFYDHLAQTYDYFIDWETRIKREDPFFQHLFRERLASSILDLGCGTGGHAIHWAELGFNVVGLDSSTEMIEFARRRAEQEEIDIEFQCLSMTDFTTRIQQKFDVIVCLGNTVSHLLDAETLKKMYQQTVASLKESGVAVFHALNFRRIQEFKRRDFPVKSRVVDDKEYVFIRFYDFRNDELEFNFVVSARENGEWISRSYQLKHHPWMQPDLVALAKASGFTEVMCYGGYDFSEFDPEKSDDLLLVCERGEG